MSGDNRTRRQLKKWFAALLFVCSIGLGVAACAVIFSSPSFTCSRLSADDPSCVDECARSCKTDTDCSCVGRDHSQGVAGGIVLCVFIGVFTFFLIVMWGLRCSAGYHQLTPPEDMPSTEDEGELDEEERADSSTYSTESADSDLSFMGKGKEEKRD